MALSMATVFIIFAYFYIAVPWILFIYIMSLISVKRIAAMKDEPFAPAANKFYTWLKLQPLCWIGLVFLLPWAIDEGSLNFLIDLEPLMWLVDIISAPILFQLPTFFAFRRFGGQLEAVGDTKLAGRTKLIAWLVVVPFCPIAVVLVPAALSTAGVPLIIFGIITAAIVVVIKKRQ